MSDFLSNFDKKKYTETKGKKEHEKQEEKLENNKENKGNLFEEQTSYDRLVKKVSGGLESERNVFGPENDEIEKLRATDERKEVSRRSSSEDETEIDLSYHKRKRQKQMLIGVSILMVISCLFVIYYQSTHVKLPNFKGKEVSEVRTWAATNKIKLTIDSVYDLKSKVNEIVAQKIEPGKKIKKGSELTVKASLGADPEEKLSLPDFMSMNKSDTEKWIKEQQAKNVSLIDAYSDTVEKGKTVRVEIVNKDVTKETYRRKDKVNVYYSKGKETFEKNISVPDFTKKNKTEVESWAKSNEVNVTYEEDSSSEIPEGEIISQSIAKSQKIAKKENMTVTVSLGKGFVVPNFAEYSPEEAATAVEGLTVQVKTIFTVGVPYGQLVSQSVEAGTRLTSKNDLKVKVYYSAGQPYLKDLRGNTIEGDLQKYFYDEFKSKEANVSYIIRYVDSAEPKGTVVGMSAHSLYVPLDYTVTLDISLGNSGDTLPQKSPEAPDEEDQKE